MKVAEFYSHKDGYDFVAQGHPEEFKDVQEAIESTDAVVSLCKISKERSKPSLIFSQADITRQIKDFLHVRGWTRPARNPNARKKYTEPRIDFGGGAFREMDGIKNLVGCEIQFGKYAFMGYDIFSKMVIFANRGLIECGIEVVGMPDLIAHMSTGASAFPQLVLDLRERGVADIDIPTVVIGITLTYEEELKAQAKRIKFTQYRAEMIASGEVSEGREDA
jgi:hypothetical protein